jgi:hypothetical protein
MSTEHDSWVRLDKYEKEYFILTTNSKRHNKALSFRVPRAQQESVIADLRSNYILAYGFDGFAGSLEYFDKSRDKRAQILRELRGCSRSELMEYILAGREYYKTPDDCVKYARLESFGLRIAPSPVFMHLQQTREHLCQIKKECQALRTDGYSIFDVDLDNSRIYDKCRRRLGSILINEAPEYLYKVVLVVYQISPRYKAVELLPWVAREAGGSKKTKTPDL